MQLARQTAPLIHAAAVADPIDQQIEQLLLDQDCYVAWYQQAGRLDKPPAQRSKVALASDQILYGSYLLEQLKMDAFQNWWTIFRKQWRNSDGSYQGALSLDPLVAVNTNTDWLRINFSVARLLVQSVSVWPDSGRQDDLEELSQLLLAKLDQGVPVDQIAVIPTSRPILDPGATPTPKPSMTPTPGPDAETTLPVIRLASIDLYAMSLMTQIDSRWSVWTDYYRDLLMEGYLQDAVPLFAWAWQPQQEGYVPFQGSVPQIDTLEAVLTILHLCEVDACPEQSVNWLREQLFNQRILYQTYHPVQGIAVDKAECIASYAICARIARIIDDPYLYEAATDRLLWHQATSQTSDILGAIFRQKTDEPATVWAYDNFWALLALR